MPIIRTTAVADSSRRSPKGCRYGRAGLSFVSGSGLTGSDGAGLAGARSTLGAAGSGIAGLEGAAFPRVPRAEWAAPVRA